MNWAATLFRKQVSCLAARGNGAATVEWLLDASKSDLLEGDGGRGYCSAGRKSRISARDNWFFVAFSRSVMNC